MSAPSIDQHPFEQNEYRVFPAWSNRNRLVASWVLLSLGFLTQALILGFDIVTDYSRNAFEALAILVAFLGGFVFAGNCFFLVRSITNDPGISDKDGKWQTFEVDRLDALLEFDKKMTDWSGDPVCSQHGFILYLLPVAFGLAVYLGWEWGSLSIFAIGINGILILVPHLLTGRRKAHREPTLIQKTKTFKKILRNSSNLLREFNLEVLLFLVGGESKIPKDVKLRIRSPISPPSFLGMEAHIALNEVKNTKYNYFYVVLIARPEFGLPGFQVEIGEKMVAETKTESGIDVLVIRQNTTKTSGYHTDDEAALRIFQVGLANLLRLQANGG
jgi:hypothetical protein